MNIEQEAISRGQIIEKAMAQIKDMTTTTTYASFCKHKGQDNLHQR
jgi:hypothetical protein